MKDINMIKQEPEYMQMSSEVPFGSQAKQSEVQEFVGNKMPILLHVRKQNELDIQLMQTALEADNKYM